MAEIPGRKMTSKLQYTTEHGTYPRLQLLTIADLLNGKLPRIPFGYSEGYKRAAREEEEKQGLLI